MHEAAPDAEYIPALQLAHEVDARAPEVEEKVPAGQLAHDDAPETDRYFPTSQVLQLRDATVEYCPATHEAQADAAVDAW